MSIHQFRLFDLKQLVTISAKGEPALVEKSAEGLGHLFPVRGPFPATQFFLPLDFGQGVVDEPLSPGITVMSGRTKAGKSAALRMLPQVSALQTVEPFDNPATIPETIDFDSADAAIIHALSQIMILGAGKHPLYAIDSLRAPLFETSGNAGSKGIVMPFFTKFTRVSNSLARAGVSMLATINPMNEGDAYVSEFLSYLSASSQAYIELETVSDSGFTGKYQARGGALHRQARQFSFSQANSKPGLAASPVVLDFAPAEGVRYPSISKSSVNSLTQESI